MPRVSEIPRPLCPSSSLKLSSNLSPQFLARDSYSLFLLLSTLSYLLSVPQLCPHCSCHSLGAVLPPWSLPLLLLQ